MHFFKVKVSNAECHCLRWLLIYSKGICLFVYGSSLWSPVGCVRIWRQQQRHVIVLLGCCYHEHNVNRWKERGLALCLEILGYLESEFVCTCEEALLSDQLPQSAIFVGCARLDSFPVKSSVSFSRLLLEERDGDIGSWTAKRSVQDVCRQWIAVILHLSSSHAKRNQHKSRNDADVWRHLRRR